MIPSTLIYGGAASLLILLWLVYRYGLLLPSPAGLPILLYHKVSLHQNDGLTISADRLDRQLSYIKSQGYTAISFLELKESLDGLRALPPKPIIVTFDDGYVSTGELAYPLLRKQQMKATVFVPTSFIGGTNEWDGGGEPLLNYEAIRTLAGNGIEFGLHSCRHENYQFYSAAEVETDISGCVQIVDASGGMFTRVFAYPYGRMPKDREVQKAMREAFRRHSIFFAARIGSRINSLPPKDIYELKRTVIEGTDSFPEFKIKLKKGRTKLF